MCVSCPLCSWVNHAGRFDPCCAPDEQRSLWLGSFGNVQREEDGSSNIMAIWNGNAYQQLVRNYAENPLCQGCNMRLPPAKEEEEEESSGHAQALAKQD